MLRNTNMTRRMVLALGWAFCLVAADTTESSANREMVRVALQKMSECNQRANKELLNTRRMDNKQFDGSGKLVSRNVYTLRRETWEDLIVTRVVSRDDKPLSEAELKAQDPAISKSVAAYRTRVAKGEKREESAEDEWLRQMPDALLYERAASESINGRPAIKLNFSPDAKWKAPSMRARIFEKVKGSIWIDEAEKHLVRLEAEVFDDVNIALGILGKIEKNTLFRMDRMRYEPDYWVQSYQRMRFNVRMMMVRKMRRDTEMQWKDFYPRPASKKA
jgi:hypothetical protein